MVARGGTESRRRITLVLEVPKMPEENSGSGEYSIRCAEFGDVDCNWEGYGRDQIEVMSEAERHAREEHGWTTFTEEMTNKVRSLIRRKAA